MSTLQIRLMLTLFILQRGKARVPFIVLVIATLLLKAIGAAGVTLLNDWTWCLRGGLALMFLLTASAHWGKRRADLVAMVPGVFPRPDLMVSATGVLEILGAMRLLIPAIAPSPRRAWRCC